MTQLFASLKHATHASIVLLSSTLDDVACMTLYPQLYLIFRPNCSARRGRLCMRARAHPGWSCDLANWLVQSLTRWVVLQRSLAKAPKSRRLEYNSSFWKAPMDNSDSRISLVCRHQAAVRKPTLRSKPAPPPFSSGYFSQRLVPLPAVLMDCLMYRPSPAMKREKMFLARVELLPATSRSHTVTDIQM